MKKVRKNVSVHKYNKTTVKTNYKKKLFNERLVIICIATDDILKKGISIVKSKTFDFDTTETAYNKNIEVIKEKSVKDNKNNATLVLNLNTKLQMAKQEVRKLTKSTTICQQCLKKTNL